MVRGHLGPEPFLRAGFTGRVVAVVRGGLGQHLAVHRGQPALALPGGLPRGGIYGAAGLVIRCPWASRTHVHSPASMASCWSAGTEGDELGDRDGRLLGLAVGVDDPGGAPAVIAPALSRLLRG